MLDGQFIGLLVWADLLAIAAFGSVPSARAAESLDRHPRRFQTLGEATVIESPQRGFRS